MLAEIKNNYSHFFVDEYRRRQGKYKTWWYNKQPDVVCYYLDGKIHGEYKQWHDNGQMWVNCFFVNGNMHGEYKMWDSDGTLFKHCFYVNSIRKSFSKLPYPETEEDRVYFKLKYDLQLFPLAK